MYWKDNVLREAIFAKGNLRKPLQGVFATTVPPYLLSPKNRPQVRTLLQSFHYRHLPTIPKHVCCWVDRCVLGSPSNGPEPKTGDTDQHVAG